MLSMIINNNQCCKKNKHLSISHMLSTVEYSNRLGMKYFLPDSSHHYIKYSYQNHYILHIRLILMNRRCMLWVILNNSRYCRSNKRQKFNCKCRSLKYSNKLNMKLLLLSSSHYCMKHKHMKSGCRYHNL